jgi:hypothetical protein
LSSTLAGTNVTVKSTSTAGAGGTGTSNGAAGAASASAQATALGSGKASATAVVANGASSGGALANSTSKSGTGASVSASGAAPVGGVGTAISQSIFGGGAPLAPAISSVGKGTSASYVTGLPTGPFTTDAAVEAAAFTGGTLYALGAITNVYGNTGQSATYTTTANFSFNYGANSEFRLAAGLAAAIGVGFDSSDLRVLVNGVETFDKSFATYADWVDFFFIPTGGLNPVDIGVFLPGGLADVELIYTLTASSLNSGFQFDYAFGTVPGASVNPVPEPAALPLFAAGLGALGLVAWHRKKKSSASFPAT